jgi:hypothetical protein
VTASWQHPPAPTIGLAAALSSGCIGVDTDNDHLAAWRLDAHGNPAGAPRRFAYDLSGSADHRDAQVRHALTRLPHWAQACGVNAIAVDPAYTSKWGAEHWQQPLDGPTRKTTRHDAASIVIGRRAQGHKARRRTPPPPPDRSDRVRHRSAQARPDVPGREEPRRRIPGPRTRGPSPDSGPKAGNQCAQHRPGHTTEHAQLMSSV